jgi:hypothetical protein
MEFPITTKMIYSSGYWIEKIPDKMADAILFIES